MSVTVSQLFYDAYRDSQLVALEQTGLNTDQVEEARTQFNRLIDSLALDGGMVSHIARLGFNVIPGKGDYTVGENGDLDPGQPVFASSAIGSNYPVRIERASVLITSQTTPPGSGPPELELYPMTIDQWQAWVYKQQTTTYSRHYYYEPSYPLGIFHMLYVPTESDQIVLYIEETLAQIDATGDEILNFRPGYQDMLTTELAMRIGRRRPGWRPTPELAEASRSSKSLVKMANARPLSRTTDAPGSGTRWRSNIFTSSGRYGNS